MDLDVYLALRSSGQIVLWPKGKGPEKTRPKKYRKIGTSFLPVRPLPLTEIREEKPNA